MKKEIGIHKRKRVNKQFLPATKIVGNLGQYYVEN